MLKIIIAALAAALAFAKNIKSKVTALNQAVKDRDAVIAERDKQIEALLQVIEDDKSDDAALEAAAAEAREKQAVAENRARELDGQLQEINADLPEALAKADALAKEISDNPEIPIVVNPDGNVIDQTAGQSLGQVEAAARSNEGKAAPRSA